MKNTIFIGPYRQDNFNGKWSRSLLDHLIRTKETNSVIARPIYLEDSKVEECSTEIIGSELVDENHYDILVQNTFLDGIITVPKLKNYVIPITTNKKISKEQIESLYQCDKILVDNFFQYREYSELFPDKTFLFDYAINSPKVSSVKKIDMGIYNHMQKMYFIGSYAKNQDLIKMLINISVLIHRYRENICMVIFLTDQTNDTTKELKEYSEKIYKELKINNIINKNIFFNMNYNLDNLMMCHSSCDIFLDINEDIGHSFNRKCAEHFDNFILGSEDLEFHLEFSRNELAYDHGHYVPLQTKLIQAINGATSYKKIPQTCEKVSLENLIWN